MLHAARDIRAAVRAQRAAASQALDAYDSATGDRLAEAIVFLRALKESDQAYAEARARALERYAGRIRVRGATGSQPNGGGSAWLVPGASQLEVHPNGREARRRETDSPAQSGV